MRALALCCFNLGHHRSSRSYISGSRRRKSETFVNSLNFGWSDGSRSGAKCDVLFIRKTSKALLSRRVQAFIKRLVNILLSKCEPVFWRLWAFAFALAFPFIKYPLDFVGLLEHVLVERRGTVITGPRFGLLPTFLLLAVRVQSLAHISEIEVRS